MEVKVAKGWDHAIGGRLASGGPLGLSGSPRSPSGETSLSFT